MNHYDRIIIGAGIYGLYAALHCVRHGEHVLVLEGETRPFERATYINQARVHQGYHYPRSLSTALKSAGYFERFNHDFSFCINRAFDQVYATSAEYSWTDGFQFKEFCMAAGIPCEELVPGNYFRRGMCDSAFRTREYTYDAMILRDYYLKELGSRAELKWHDPVVAIERDSDRYIVYTKSGNRQSTRFLLDAAYASTNQILKMVSAEPFRIKYELCEIILCNASDVLKPIGFTVMDGPFFSIMPFGKTGFHSLTSVTFTPHATSYESLPHFDCQGKMGNHCSPDHLENCNLCISKPATAYPYMSSLARKYLLEEYGFSYQSSLFSMKPILMNSEIDDSRPTVIRKISESPTFIAVLSGKVNTVYDLDEVLEHG